MSSKDSCGTQDPEHDGIKQDILRIKMASR